MKIRDLSGNEEENKMPTVVGIKSVTYGIDYLSVTGAEPMLM